MIISSSKAKTKLMGRLLIVFGFLTCAAVACKGFMFPALSRDVSVTFLFSHGNDFCFSHEKYFYRMPIRSEVISKQDYLPCSVIALDCV